MAETNASQTKKLPQKQLRYFVSSLNSFVGHAVVETLRNDHQNDENPHFIVGSKCESEISEIPRGVFRVIDTTQTNFLAKVYLDSDVIIYDLNTCDLQEAEFAIKTLKMGDYKQEKILICISTVMVWSATPPKEQKEDATEGEDEGGEEEPDSQAEAENEKAQDDAPQKVFLRFTQKDYTRRKPLPQYEILKSIETLCLSAGNSKPNLKCFVLCSGILYGNGQEVLYDHFKQAWLQSPAELSLYGEGKNRVPMIHVRDLATFVKQVVEQPPTTLNYIFAVDHNTKPTQKKLIESISKGLGTGKTKKISLVDGALQNQNFDIFTLDLRLRPSKVWDGLEEENAEGGGEEEEGGQPKYRFKFDWHCKEGIVKNIQKVVVQFNTFRGLRANKILINGPPASGKTYFGQRIAQFYNIPHIVIGDVVEAVKQLQDPLGEECRTAWQEIKQKMTEEAEAAFQAEKKKKKPQKGEPQMVFDPTAIKPRLPAEMIYKAYQWRLAQNDCRNRGFLLDGFPRLNQDALLTFMKPQILQDGTQSETEKVLDIHITPDSFILLEGPDDFLKSRVQLLPEDQVVGTHYTEDGMVRRLAVYRKTNEAGTGNPILEDFFKTKNISILKIDVSNATNEILDSSKSFVDRNGKFNNYQRLEEEEESKRKQDIQQHIKTEKSHIEDIQQEKDAQQEEARLLQQEECRIKLQNLQNQEREILDTRSQPLRQYLADNVVPFLTEGLIEICQQLPEDPVDALAEYLFQRSLQVQFPDPSSYNPYN